MGKGGPVRVGKKESVSLDQNGTVINFLPRGFRSCDRVRVWCSRPTLSGCSPQPCYAEASRCSTIWCGCIAGLHSAKRPIFAYHKDTMRDTSISITREWSPLYVGLIWCLFKVEKVRDWWRMEWRWKRLNRNMKVDNTDIVRRQVCLFRLFVSVCMCLCVFWWATLSLCVCWENCWKTVRLASPRAEEGKPSWFESLTLDLTVTQRLVTLAIHTFCLLSYPLALPALSLCLSACLSLSLSPSRSLSLFLSLSLWIPNHIPPRLILCLRTVLLFNLPYVIMISLSVCSMNLDLSGLSNGRLLLSCTVRMPRLFT